VVQTALYRYVVKSSNHHAVCIDYVVNLVSMNQKILKFFFYIIQYASNGIPMEFGLFLFFTNDFSQFYWYLVFRRVYL